MSDAHECRHRARDGIDTLETCLSKTIMLDVREPEEYTHGHIPGAINLPQADLASRLHEVLRDRPVWTICQSGFRSLWTAQFLKQMGFDTVASVKGGMAAWRATNKPVAL